MKKPEIEEIQEYMIERGLPFYFDDDGERHIQDDQDEAFFDHHEAGGWKIGKKPMVKWQAAVRTWMRNARKWSKRDEGHKPNNQSFSDQQREQADRARQNISASRGGVCRDNVRSIRSIG